VTKKNRLNPNGFSLFLSKNDQDLLLDLDNQNFRIAPE
jgi:hypothetical protein